MCSLSQHAKGLVFVTDKMAAASDDCDDSAYIYQENDSALSLSFTFRGTDLPRSDCNTLRIPQSDLFSSFRKACLLGSCDWIFKMTNLDASLAPLGEHRHVSDQLWNN